MATWRFAVFELDDESRELRRQGTRIHLAAQPAKVLALLVSRAGEVVTRDEMRRHLWSDDTFVEFDRSLNFCVAAVRAALRDDARSPRFVETIPRRGYRFVADVTRVEPPKGPAEAGHDDRAEAGRCDRVEARRDDRRWWWAAVVLLVLWQQPAPPIAHSRTTARPEARAAFQRALAATDEGDAGRRRGIAALRAATRLDPRFAEAHYALADLYLHLAVKRELPMDAALGEARAAAERALALEDVAESRQVLGTIYLLDGEWRAARRELEHALALAPQWDSGLVSYARLLSAEGDDRAAVGAIDRAETISPNCDLILFDAGHVYARARRLDEAAQKYRRAIEFGPPASATAESWRRDVEFRLLAVHVVRGDWPAAHASAQAILAANGVDPEARARFAARNPRDAVTMFLRRSAADLTSRRAREPIGATAVATLHALAGDAGAALDWLERAISERDPELVYGLRNPEFELLRGSPRYRALATRVMGGTSAN